MATVASRAWSPWSIRKASSALTGGCHESRANWRRRPLHGAEALRHALAAATGIRSERNQGLLGWLVAFLAGRRCRARRDADREGLCGHRGRGDGRHRLGRGDARPARLVPSRAERGALDCEQDEPAGHHARGPALSAEGVGPWPPIT